MFRSIVVVVMSFMMVFNVMGLGKIEPKVKIKEYIGIAYSKLPKEIKELEADKKVVINYESQGTITEIMIKDSKIPVDSIKVGDTLSSIIQVYPEAWIVSKVNEVIILKERATHYGIPTTYITYLSEDGKKISEIRIGYIANFTKEELPTSNKEAKELLQGKWQSTKNKELIFEDSNLSDSIFNKLYDNQEYKVISPNEMIIYRYTKDNSEKVKLRFWVTQDVLYTFAVDEFEVPIKETIEVFKRVK